MQEQAERHSAKLHFTLADGSKAPTAKFNRDKYECRTEAARTYPDRWGSVFQDRENRYNAALECMSVRGYIYTKE